MQVTIHIDVIIVRAEIHACNTTYTHTHKKTSCVLRSLDIDKTHRPKTNVSGRAHHKHTVKARYYVFKCKDEVSVLKKASEAASRSDAKVTLNLKESFSKGDAPRILRARAYDVEC